MLSTHPYPDYSVLLISIKTSSRMARGLLGQGGHRHVEASPVSVVVSFVPVRDRPETSGSGQTCRWGQVRIVLDAVVQVAEAGVVASGRGCLGPSSASGRRRQCVYVRSWKFWSRQPAGWPQGGGAALGCRALSCAAPSRGCGRVRGCSLEHDDGAAAAAVGLLREPLPGLGHRSSRWWRDSWRSALGQDQALPVVHRLGSIRGLLSPSTLTLRAARGSVHGSESRRSKGRRG